MISKACMQGPGANCEQKGEPAFRRPHPTRAHLQAGNEPSYLFNIPQREELTVQRPFH